jgi:hypothetical protein
VESNIFKKNVLIIIQLFLFLHQEEVEEFTCGLQEDLVDMQNLLKINYLMFICQGITFKMLETIYDFIRIILKHILKNIIFA